MALETNELFSSVTRGPFGRMDPRHVFSKTLAAIGAAPSLLAATPMAFNTSTNLWVPWTNAGANGTGTIRAFVYPDAIQTHATNEVLGQLMVEGSIHAADVALPSGESQGNLDTALKAGLSERGLYVTGLAGTY